MATRSCPECGENTYRYRCFCGGLTVARRVEKVKVDLRSELKRSMNFLGEIDVPDMKGVEGLISPSKEPEPLEKGILRAKHALHVNKDGTMRYDLTDVPLTHFRPAEINVSVEKLRELGYDRDFDGEELMDSEQTIELMPQDVVVSEDCMNFMLRASGFMDDLFSEFYGLEKYYNADNFENIVGSLVVGLAPHTSAGVLGRIIGYTNAKVCFAHPFFHAAKRRNCDGDEDSLMLLTDALTNFSIHYLPKSRGSRMDCPLLMNIVIDPKEIDKEAWNLDVMRNYPLDFYAAAENGEHPKDILDFMDIIEKRLDSKISPIGFSFDTERIDEGNTISSYKTLESMAQKIALQLALARKLRGVDEVDVAAKVINTHLLPDIMGNLSAFSRQEVRCPSCNAKYRRVPLCGKCTKCGKNLTLTVHKGSVKKYLDISKEIMDNYEIPMYLKQCIMVAEASIDSLFENVKIRTLADFMEVK